MKNARGSIKQTLDDLGIIKLQEIYQEEQTLMNVAKRLNISLESIRKYFIKNNIDYEKQLVYDVDHDFFGRDNEQSFYWAGFCAADLGIDKVKPRLKLGLAT